MTKNAFLILLFLFVNNIKITAQKINEKDSLYLRSLMIKAIDFQYENLDSSNYYSNFLVNESVRLKSLFFQAKAYNQLGSNFRKIGIDDSVVKYYNRALEISEKFNYKALQSDVLSNYSQYYLVKGDFYASLELLKKSIDIDLRNGFTTYLESSLIDLGNIYIELSDKKSALKYYNFALNLSLNNKNYKYAGGALINIAKIFSLENDYDNTLKYTLLAKKYFELEGNQRDILFVYEKLSTIYKNRKMYDKAIKYCKKIINGYEGYTEYSLKSNAYELLGLIYADLKEYDTALDYINQSIAIRINTNQLYTIPNSYINSSYILLKQKKYNQSKQHLHEGLKIADSLKLNDALIDIYKNLATVDSALGDYKSAFNHIKLYKAYSDSVYNDENRMALERFKIQSEFEYKERLNKDQEEFKRIEYEQSITLAQTKLYGTILLFILIAGALIFYAYQQRKFRKQREKLSLLMVRDSELKALQSQINTHFVYNALNGVCSFIYSNLPEKALIYMNKFANHLRITLENSRKSWVTLASEIESVKCYVEIESLQLDYPPNFNVTIDESINSELVFIPPMLLQPMIENSFKHAININPENAKLLIEIKHVNAQIQISVIDNGPELAKQKVSKHKGLSLSSKINYDRLDVINQQYKSNIQFRFYQEKTSIGASSIAELCLPFVNEAMVA